MTKCIHQYRFFVVSFINRPDSGRMDHAYGCTGNLRTILLRHVYDISKGLSEAINY
jgi:hypothetical protein